MKSCCFLGYDNFDKYSVCKNIESLITLYQVNHFYIFRHNEFNSFAYKALQFLEPVYPNICCEFINNDARKIFEIIEKTEYIMVYIDKPFGALPKIVYWAKLKGKKIINLYKYDNELF